VSVDPVVSDAFIEQFPDSSGLLTERVRRALLTHCVDIDIALPDEVESVGFRHSQRHATGFAVRTTRDLRDRWEVFISVGQVTQQWCLELKSQLERLDDL